MDTVKSRVKYIIFYLLACIAKIFYLLYLHACMVRAIFANPRYRPRELPANLNVIYAFWHSKTFMIMPIGRNCHIGVLTLTDIKNYFYDKLCTVFGYRTIPVASESGATLKLKEMLEDGFSIALAVDGPHGPPGVIRPGAVYLSQKTKKPIICIGVKSEKSFRLRKRWDRYEIPIPFTRTSITLSDPIYPGGMNAKEMTDELRKRLGAY